MCIICITEPLVHTKPLRGCWYPHKHKSQLHLCATKATEIPFTLYQQGACFNPSSSVNILGTKLSAESRAPDSSGSFGCSLVLSDCRCECGSSVDELSQFLKPQFRNWCVLPCSDGLLCLILYACIKAVLRRDRWAKPKTEAPKFFPALTGLLLELISSFAHSGFNLLH